MKNLFIGIDVASGKHNCCIINEKLEPLSQFEFSNDREGFNLLLNAVKLCRKQRNLRTYPINIHTSLVPALGNHVIIHEHSNGFLMLFTEVILVVAGMQLLPD